MIVEILAGIVLAGLTAMAAGSKLVDLSYGRFGLLVMLANLPYETAIKKMRLSRFAADVLVFAVTAAGWLLLAGAGTALAVSAILAFVWARAMHIDHECARNNPGVQDPRHVGAIPMPHPRLLIVLQGPVWDWGREWDLGDWPVGRCADYELLVLNPTILEPQCPLEVRIEAEDAAIEVRSQSAGPVDAPRPGGMVRVSVRLKARAVSARPAVVRAVFSMGGIVIERRFRVRSVFAADTATVSSAAINRWQGGALAGFAWRGDMDMYDPSTFQSVEGLRRAFGLSRRYRMASTLFLSGRLSLVPEEHAPFCRHLGVNRRTEEIAEFIRFMKDEVTLGLKMDFPCATDRSYDAELGNHMYLHYGTHAAMAPENGWKNRARMLAGRYPWQTADEGSFAEQRDNARTNIDLIRKTLGVSIRTWGVPGRDYDEHTPAAVEASGMEVGSDTNASAWTNVLALPPPHHPRGCDRLVELTKKYPGDSDNIFKIAMLKYWLWLARARRTVFVFMAHHHLLRYEGTACGAMTEHFFRFVMEKGGYFISTLYGLGTYWEKVLCPAHRCVDAEPAGAGTVRITNRSDTALDGIPVEVRFAAGRRMLLLVDLPAASTVIASVFGAAGTDSPQGGGVS